MKYVVSFQCFFLLPTALVATQGVFDRGKQMAQAFQPPYPTHPEKMPGYAGVPDIAPESVSEQAHQLMSQHTTPNGDSSRNPISAPGVFKDVVANQKKFEIDAHDPLLRQADALIRDPQKTLHVQETQDQTKQPDTQKQRVTCVEAPPVTFTESDVLHPHVGTRLGEPYRVSIQFHVNQNIGALRGVAQGSDPLGMKEGNLTPAGVQAFLSLWNKRDTSGKVYDIQPDQFNGVVSYNGGSGPEFYFYYKNKDNWSKSQFSYFNFMISLRPMESYAEDEWQTVSSEVTPLVERGLCYETERRCIEGSSTRVINDLSVTRDCWRYEVLYICQLDHQNTCQPLRDKGCTQVNSTCLEQASGRCLLYENTYLCDTTHTSLHRTILEGDLFCLDGNCTDQTWVPNTGMGEALSKLSLFQELQKQIDPSTLQAFPGRVSQCSRHLLNFKNCCASFKGWGLSMGLAECSAAEKQLAKDRSEGRAVYVGEYCAEKLPLLKICIRKKSTYCVFGSRLARVINQEGSRQVGKGFGTPKEPDCRGLSIDELSRVDFSKVNLAQSLPTHMSTTSATMSSHLADLQRNWEKRLPSSTKDATTMKQQLEDRKRDIADQTGQFSLHAEARKDPESLDLPEHVKRLKQQAPFLEGEEMKGKPGVLQF